MRHSSPTKDSVKHLLFITSANINASGKRRFEVSKDKEISLHHGVLKH